MVVIFFFFAACFPSVSETQRRFHVPQRKDPQQPGPERGAPRVRAPGRLSEVLRLPERHNSAGTGMFGERSVQRRIAEMRSARERTRMVNIFLTR